MSEVVRTAGELQDPYRLVATALACAPDTLTEESGLAHHPSWDSLGHLQVMLALEEHYGVAIDDRSIVEYQEMRAIVRRHRQIREAASASTAG